MSNKLKIEQFYSPTSMQAIMSFEVEYDVQLPNGYREFLIKNNGGIPDEGVFKIINHPRQDDVELQLFMGLNTETDSSDLRFELNLFGDCMPVGLVPIACTGCINIVCLDLRNGFEKVVYWDMLEFWGVNIWNEDMLFGISNTFEEFLSSLTVA